VELLSAELGIVPERDLPPLIECGGLRKAVRGVFPSEVGLRAELSIKTSQKLERFICRSCDSRYASLVDKWREDRFQPDEVDEGHLNSFVRAFRENVPKGWNSRKYPYIPNGCATRGFKRREGGNWNAEAFSDQARVDLVFREGKHRVVTLYSAYNSAVLAPLHYSLYDSLRRKGWLLVGPPTTERIKELTGGGDYLSFDYQSATDKIRLPYVRAGIEVLKERAEPPLDPDQIRCLDVVGQLGLGNEEATSGQPMGSYMSFPLLCLVNKTVVDLALNQMLQGGQISFKEWTSHRCLINGDDLLTREPRSESRLKECIYRQAAGVGLVTNDEKTLQHTTLAEINSTLFEGGVEVKKTNVGALYMRPGVENVLEYAARSCTTVGGFRKCVRYNAGLLARQGYKGFNTLPPHLQRVCRTDRKIRKALLSVPEAVPVEDPLNFFNVCPRPEDYALTREEEVEVINRRVERVRPSAVKLLSDRPRRAPRVRVLRDGRTWSSVKHEKKPALEEDDNILCVLARAWEERKRERLAQEGREILLYEPEFPFPPGDGPRIGTITDCVRAYRNAKGMNSSRLTSQAAPEGDWIPLDP
jgi:hypothetical protein